MDKMTKLKNAGGDKIQNLLQQVDKTAKNWTKSEQVAKSLAVLEGSLTPNTTTISSTSSTLSAVTNGSDVMTYLMDSKSNNNDVYNSSLGVIPKVLMGRGAHVVKKQLMDGHDNSTMTHNDSYFNHTSHDLLSKHNEGDLTSSNSSASVDDVAFILIPLLIIIAVALFSGFALVCMQRRTRLDRLRHTLIPIYNFNPHEEDEWKVLTNHHKNSDSD